MSNIADPTVVLISMHFEYTCCLHCDQTNMPDRRGKHDVQASYQFDHNWNGSNVFRGQLTSVALHTAEVKREERQKRLQGVTHKS